MNTPKKKLMNQEDKVKAAEANGWYQEYIEGNGIDGEMWISPDEKCYYELPESAYSPDNSQGEALPQADCLVCPVCGAKPKSTRQHYSGLHMDFRGWSTSCLNPKCKTFNAPKIGYGKTIREARADFVVKNIKSNIPIESNSVADNKKEEL